MELVIILPNFNNSLCFGVSTLEGFAGGLDVKFTFATFVAPQFGTGNVPFSGKGTSFLVLDCFFLSALGICEGICVKDCGWSSFCACHDLVNVIPGTAAPHQVKRSHRTFTRFERNLTILSKKLWQERIVCFCEAKLKFVFFSLKKNSSQNNTTVGVHRERALKLRRSVAISCDF